MKSELLSYEAFMAKAKEFQKTPEQHLEAIGLPQREFAPFKEQVTEVFTDFVTNGEHDEELAKFRFGFEKRKQYPYNAESGTHPRKENGLSQGIDKAFTILEFSHYNIVPENLLILPDDEFRAQMIASFPEVTTMDRGIVNLATTLRNDKGSIQAVTPEDIQTAIGKAFTTYWDRTEVQRIVTRDDFKRRAAVK